MGRNAVLIALGLVVVSAIRLVTEPTRVSLGVFVLMVLVFAGMALGAVLVQRGRLAGARERREAMIADGLDWVADVRFDAESLDRLLGPTDRRPDTIALGVFDGEVEAWVDATGRAAVLPAAPATVVRHPRNPDAPYGITLDGLAFDVVGAAWGFLPPSEATTREVAVVLNGPVAPSPPR